jgi:hypothetical protein
VRRVREHRGQPEELARARHVDDDLLVVVVDQHDVHLPAQEHVGTLARLPRPVDPLAGGEAAQLDVVGEHRPLVGVEQREQRDVLQQRGIARHAPHLPGGA